ncbi:siderophore-interacting protein [Streptosporangium carneum]|uniref:siderophore-interacting protein n=1 Tax=Streptosporangium carneum TaxID=47481 RepID=UPI0022F2ABE6|nr:siderophore-interacting protein [Streptosporangium carneum]
MSDLKRLSPSFLRVTFTGDDLHLFADNGLDQRIKLVLPLPEHGLTHLPTGSDWYTRWRELPGELRNPFRTYTARAVRAELHEVDVDIVMHEGHGDHGPVARWARAARPGDEAALLGPDARHDGEPQGIEFHLPEGDGPVLLAGDETAVPAIASILERMPRDRSGEALLEVPYGADVLELDAPDGLVVTWLPRDGAEHGGRLVPAVRAAADRLLPSLSSPQRLADVDVDVELLWEVPEEGQATHPLYAWLAGEAAVIKTLRRHLVAERGLDRRAVAFMGYWRMGRSERSE